MIHHMTDDGVAVVLLPHGVLFRGAAEGAIREYIIDKQNYLDAVIGLPAKCFMGTSIPVACLIFKKNRGENKDNVCFIDASMYYEEGKNQNRLRDEDIDRIVNAYTERKNIEKFCHIASIEEIRDNGFNCNIPRYVNAFEQEEEIDIDAVECQLNELYHKTSEIDGKLQNYFHRLQK